MMQLVQAVGLQLLLQVPTFAVWVVGIVLAMSRRQEHPRSYRLVAIAFGIFLVMGIVGTFTSILIPYYVIGNGGSTMQVGAVATALNLVYDAVGIVAWIFVLMALFRRRDTSTTSSVDTIQRF